MNRCGLVVACLFAVGLSTAPVSAELGDRPALPPGHPDLTKGEGPDAHKIRGEWFLHCGRTRGWAFIDEHRNADQARQILVTEVPATSPVRHDMKVGDVILGVSGEYFTTNAVKQFRQHSAPARDAGGTLEVILWRKGWDKERNVTLSLAYLPLDFTRGDKPGLENDWNLGPTGARGYMQGLHGESRLTRQILITSVEEGSPAHGILRQGDVILGVEGKPFAFDARRAFVAAVNRAETEQAAGKLSVKRWRDGKTEDVIIPLKVLGAYSPTTPWNCPKSEKILGAAVDYLLANDLPNKNAPITGTSSLTALALLATGEPEHFEIAKKRVYKLADLVVNAKPYPPKWGYSTWGWSYGNLLLCEYHLMTGDAGVIPAIRRLTMLMAHGQSGVGSWGHNFAAKGNGAPPGYGAMNQCGNIAWMSLVLARKCGISDPALDAAITRGKAYLDAFVDTRTVPYGDGPSLDCARHDDNGKNSSAAVGYAIFGDHRATEYFSRMVVASYEHREFGHTGVFWSHLWAPLGAARAGQPATTAFLNEAGYLYDLERRWDGGFVYQGKMEIGYGLNEKGRQRGGSEHTTAHWDTTACRILMYCLPRKKLHITGKDILTIPVPAEQLATVIEAGRPSDQGMRYFARRYDDRSPAQLLDLLANWSPAVRTHAAASLARKPDPHQHIPALLDRLTSDNHYAVYGACMALRHMKAGSDEVVDALVKLLDHDDRVVQRQAAGALGASGNRRAVQPLLQVVLTDYPEDINDLLHRTVAQALFRKGNVLGDSIDGVDRKLLFPATRRLLRCKGGAARNDVTQGVVTKLTDEELEDFWPDLAHAMIDYPLSQVGIGSSARITIARMLADHKVPQGPEWLLAYMKNMRAHNGVARRSDIVKFMNSFGAAAKPLLPKLKAHLAFLEQTPPPNDPTRPTPPLYEKAQIDMLKQMIQTIEQAPAT
jgi:hypothetical protein